MARGRGRLTARESRRLARDAGRIAKTIDRTANGSRRPDASARRTRAIVTAIVFLGLALVVVLDRSGALSPGAAAVAEFDGVSTRVERVIDGDTLIVGIADPSTGRPLRVRLWGIDAPEAARDGVSAEPFAQEATIALSELVEGRDVTLVLEPTRARDQYGRVLAHVIVDGESAGAVLVRDGLAESVERWRHRDTERFESLERSAKRARKGIWSVSVP